MQEMRQGNSCRSLQDLFRMTLVDDLFRMTYLMILTGKKHPKIKLQRLQKIQIWTFGSPN